MSDPSGLTAAEGPVRRIPHAAKGRPPPPPRYASAHASAHASAPVRSAASADEDDDDDDEEEEDDDDGEEEEEDDGEDGPPSCTTNLIAALISVLVFFFVFCTVSYAFTGRFSEALYDLLPASFQPPVPEVLRLCSFLLCSSRLHSVFSSPFHSSVGIAEHPKKRHFNARITYVYAL